MNRPDSKKIANKITNEQLAQMLNNARKFVRDWAELSNLNKGMTKGAAWNILAKDFNVNGRYCFIVKYNMVREFGEYLPEELKPDKKPKRKPGGVAHHEEPVFDVYNPYSLKTSIINPENP